MISKLFSAKHTLIPATQTQSSLHFREGQMLRGQVQKLFPQNTALLSVNGKMLTAKLELGLVVGQTYWFEVLRSKGLPQLRPLTASRQGQEGSPEFLSRLGLPVNQKGLQLLHALQMESIPFTRQTFMEALTLLQRGEVGTSSINQLSQMIQLGWPLSKGGYLAYTEQQSANQLMMKVHELINQLNREGTTSAQRLGAELSKWLATFQRQEGKSPLVSFIQRFAEVEDVGVRQALQNVIQRLLPQGINVDEMVRFLTVRLDEEQLVVSQNKQSNQQSIASFFQQHPWSEQQKTDWMQQQISKLIPKALQVQTLMGSPLSAAEKQVVKQVIDESWSNLLRATNQQLSLAAHLQSTLQRIGLQHESVLINMKNLGQVEQSPSLKSILLQAQLEPFNRQLQGMISKLISQITGTQIIASLEQQEGFFQQLLVNYPLFFGEQSIYADIQWQGKTDKEGNIDPNHCRILFYLQLSGLDETIVDVKIQKKKIDISLYNDHPKPTMLLEMFVPTLKERLKELDYELLSLQWKQQIQVYEPLKTSNQQGYQNYSHYQGVDIRI